LAVIASFALAATVLLFSPASADAAPTSLSVTSTITPATATWTYYAQYPMQWICVYVGNQLMFTGSYQAYSCRAGTPGQIALWVLPVA
jgi:hypothetical protein